jgi:murein DD-endopeptidase MepM/ murein hydrolase activator NlpD
VDRLLTGPDVPRRRHEPVPGTRSSWLLTAFLTRPRTAGSRLYNGSVRVVSRIRSASVGELAGCIAATSRPEIEMRGILLAALAAIIGMPLLVVTLAAGTPTSTAGDGAARGSGLSIPPAYTTLVTDAASSCPGLPVNILAAQLQVESDWNPQARSPAGAVGIAQFLPGTWASWGLDGDHDGVANPLDPADAIPSAAGYDCAIKQMVNGLPGEPLQLMLAAYNAGPAAVLNAGGIPNITETKSYVTKILALAGSQAPGGTAGSGCVAPIHGVITQPYGGPNGHPGLDIAAPENTPVVAACAGTVTWAQWTSGYGNYIQIQRDSSTVTAYGHLNIMDVAVGQSVAVGQIIGLEGSTGDSTGPHLHFEVRDGTWGATRDPAEWLSGQGISLG